MEQFSSCLQLKWKLSSKMYIFFVCFNVTFSTDFFLHVDRTPATLPDFDAPWKKAWAVECTHPIPASYNLTKATSRKKKTTHHGRFTLKLVKGNQIKEEDDKNKFMMIFKPNFCIFYSAFISSIVQSSSDSVTGLFRKFRWDLSTFIEYLHELRFSRSDVDSWQKLFFMESCKQLIIHIYWLEKRIYS